MSLNKRWRGALERVYLAEIENRLPLQSRSKVFKQLEEAGLVELWTREFGSDRFGAISVTGWNLTNTGRYLYCVTCA